MVTLFQNDGGTVVQLLAEKYDTDIDHHLDEIRFHRSRVNYVNKAEPVGVTKRITGEAKSAPKVYTPFSKLPARVTFENGTFTAELGEETAYVILRFEN